MVFKKLCRKFRETSVLNCRLRKRILAASGTFATILKWCKALSSIFAASGGPSG